VTKRNALETFWVSLTSIKNKTLYTVVHA